MQYWYCSKAGAFVIAGPTGNIIGTVNDESEVAGFAALAYHKDDRPDLVLAGLVPS